jgi:hypothetical protein
MATPGWKRRVDRLEAIEEVSEDVGQIEYPTVCNSSDWPRLVDEQLGLVRNLPGPQLSYTDTQGS